MSITTMELLQRIVEVKSGPMKNASQIKFDKNGIAVEYECAGKKIQVNVDRDLPTTFILSKIETFLDSIEKDVKDRL